MVEWCMAPHSLTLLKGIQFFVVASAQGGIAHSVMAIQWWGSARIRVVEMVAGGTEVEVVEVVDQQVVVGRKVSHKKVE